MTVIFRKIFRFTGWVGTTNPLAKRFKKTLLWERIVRPIYVRMRGLNDSTKLKMKESREYFSLNAERIEPNYKFYCRHNYPYPRTTETVLYAQITEDK